ncbi:unnamed protein product [Adineta steineri]|uniref:Transmembrane protein n=1 Tax=Adineta steineri TaxID=433720 RepID=A0A815LVS9_9BILA|nr:unnamed protein product [Adineta steineri]
MPPQIDKTLSLDQSYNTKQSFTDLNEQNGFNIRKFLLILLFAQWFICIVTLAVGIYAIYIANTVDISNDIKSLIPVIALTLYYTFGLLVAYKQYRTGLFIFAIIGVILFIAISILLIYIILAITVLGFGNNTNQVYEYIIFIVIFFILMTIVAILSLKLSFDLVKLLKTNEYTTV